MSAQRTEDGARAEIEYLDRGDLAAGHEELAIIPVTGRVGHVLEAGQRFDGLVAGRTVDLHAAAARDCKVVRRQR